MFCVFQPPKVQKKCNADKDFKIYGQRIKNYCVSLHASIDSMHAKNKQSQFVISIIN